MQSEGQPFSSQVVISHLQTMISKSLKSKGDPEITCYLSILIGEFCKFWYVFQNFMHKTVRTVASKYKSLQVVDRFQNSPKGAKLTNQH